MLEENAIVRVMRSRAIINHYGPDEAKRITEKLLKEHKLDEAVDQPVPQWAIDILKNPRVGYRTRIKILMTHQFDITDVNPSWRFVLPMEAENAPPKPPPKWLVEFRAKRLAETKKYLEKKEKDNVQV